MSKRLGAQYQNGCFVKGVVEGCAARAVSERKNDFHNNQCLRLFKERYSLGHTFTAWGAKIGIMGSAGSVKGVCVWGGGAAGKGGV